MNDLDARIRAAVTELADAAPPPKPLPRAAGEPRRSHRPLAIAAASALVVGGIVAVAASQSSRENAAPADTPVIGVTLPTPDTPRDTPRDTLPGPGPTGVTPTVPSLAPANTDPVITTGRLATAEVALLTEQLDYDGTCLYSAGVGGATLLVWPDGTTWDAAAAQVVLPSGTPVRAGDAIVAGGGFHAVADLPAFGVEQDGLDLATRCAERIGSAQRGDGVFVMQGGVSVVEPAFTSEAIENTPLPAGELAFGPDDIVATRTDGDLWWYPGLLGGAPGAPVRLLDMADPRQDIEGGGPNVIDAVAGAVDGTLVYGDCCEPAAGNVAALTAPGAAPVPLTGGYSPVIDPTGTRLATVNSFGLTVGDVRTGESTFLSFDSEPQVNRVAVTWAGNSGESLAVLGWTDAGWQLERFFPIDEPVRTSVVPLGFDSPVSTTAPATVTIVGLDAGWNIVLAVTDASGTRIETYSPDDLARNGDSWTGPLPAGATSVRLDRDQPGGERLIWVEGDTLFARTYASEPIELAGDISDAWFVPHPDAIG